MSQNPTLSAATKKLAKATGAKHTVCLRALEQSACTTTDPAERLELAARILATGGTAGPSGVPAAPAFDIATWWGAAGTLASTAPP